VFERSRCVKAAMVVGDANCRWYLRLHGGASRIWLVARKTHICGGAMSRCRNGMEDHVEVQIGVAAGDVRLLRLCYTHGGSVHRLDNAIFRGRAAVGSCERNGGLRRRFTNGGWVVCIHCSDDGCVKVVAMVIELRKEKHVVGSRTVVEALRCITDLGFSHGEGEK